MKRPILLSALALTVLAGFGLAQAQDVNVARSNQLLEIEIDLTAQALAFAANDLVAAKIEFPNVVQSAPGGARIVGTWLLSAQDVDYDLILFDNDPSSTTFTLNTLLAISDVDLPRVLGFIKIDTPAAASENSVLRAEPDQPLNFTATTTLYGALVTRGAPTYATTTDLRLRVPIERMQAAT